MSILVAQFQGRFGNACLQYLFARAYAEKYGFDLQCESWIGERIFAIESTRPHNYDALPRYNEDQLMRNGPPDHSFVFRGYGQTTWCAQQYTKRMAQAWLPLRAEVVTPIKQIVPQIYPLDRVVAHRRVGDYVGYGYPIVSLASYFEAARAYGLELRPEKVLSEENPTRHDGLPDDLSFVVDFYRMMHAPTLLRANSSFSFLAALLGNGLVLSPVIDGLEGGKEHDVNFVAGNHSRFANLDFVQPLYISP